jgi:hypothetical protein
MDRHVLANAIAVAQYQRAARLMNVQVLGPPPDDGAFADFIAVAENAARLNYYPRLQATLIADDHPILNNAEGANDNARSQLCSRIDNGSGVNLGHGHPFLRPHEPIASLSLKSAAAGQAL